MARHHHAEDILTGLGAGAGIKPVSALKTALNSTLSVALGLFVVHCLDLKIFLSLFEETKKPAVVWKKEGG